MLSEPTELLLREEMKIYPVEPSLMWSIFLMSSAVLPLDMAGEVHQPPDLEDVDEATNRRL